jgi:hypothetical protein
VHSLLSTTLHYINTSPSFLSSVFSFIHPITLSHHLTQFPVQCLLFYPPRYTISPPHPVSCPVSSLLSTPLHYLSSSRSFLHPLNNDLAKIQVLWYDTPYRLVNI